METRVEEGKIVKYGDGEEIENVKMTKYEKRGRRAQHLEKISFFKVLLAMSLSSFWTKS
jgi:hypothetical protein